MFRGVEDVDPKPSSWANVSESNFFVRDLKRHGVPFAPRVARSSTALKMTRTKKRQAKRRRDLIKNNEWWIMNNYQSTHSFWITSKTTPVWKFLVKFFSKNLRGFGASSPIIILPKTQEWVNSFATQRKRANPRRGFALVLVYCFLRGGRNFL